MNKKVIAELNKQLKESYKKFTNASDFNTRKSYYFGKCEAYRKALVLLKRYN